MRALLFLGVIAACSGGGTKTPTAPKKPLTAKEIVQRSSPAIVFVEVAGEGDARGSGTGFILDKTGLIATNFHVVAGMKTIKVKLYGGETYEVQQIAGVDAARDLALLRIQPTKALPTVRLGNSETMAVGDQVVTIGNPLGMDFTVSSGLLSQIRPECTNDMVAFAKANVKRFEELLIKYKTTGKLTEEELKEAQGMTTRGVTCRAELTYFQFNAPISQGSSGGPLFNLAGEVIGVTTGIIKDGQNLNIAVPTNYLKPILANPVAISVQEFTAATKDAIPKQQQPQGDEDDDPWQIVRNVPIHAANLLDGCSGDQIINLENEIWSAIEIGAPLYNLRTNKGIEACFRVYEGTSNKFEQSPPCKGVKQAFADGLLRASALPRYKAKAWTMRDTFDGLLAAAKKWRDANPGKWDPAKLKTKDKP